MTEKESIKDIKENMSIDETIIELRKTAKEKYLEAFLCHANPDDGELNSINESARYCEQLAEWLEELKVYQQHEIICNKGYNAGYNKAIDDFAEKLLSQQIVDKSVVRRVKEQLKAGGNNEDCV